MLRDIVAQGPSNSRRIKSVGGYFFQAEDGIRDAQESRGLGDVYKRQTDCHEQWKRVT